MEKLIRMSDAFSLEKVLSNQGYIKLLLEQNKVGHFQLKGYLNGIPINLILDTGASGSVIDLESASQYELQVEAQEEKASGLGVLDAEMSKAEGNKLKLGTLELEGLSLNLLDLTSVNTALVNEGASPIQGILGSDLLRNHTAIIDYAENKLYLKAIG